GGSFSLALALLVLRSASPAVAGELSGMSQGIGYCLAALGPLAVGVLLQYDVSLTGIWLLLTAVVLLAAVLAMLAGRQLVLDVDASGRFVTSSPAG
ncbi:MAG: hypothetical protein NWQ24_03485, partial [Haliea sp.]|nr:hypothetical protein [Haliea sp.]